jgi:hypothetical protein
LGLEEKVQNKILNKQFLLLIGKKEFIIQQKLVVSVDFNTFTKFQLNHRRYSMLNSNSALGKID